MRQLVWVMLATLLSIGCGDDDDTSLDGAAGEGGADTGAGGEGATGGDATGSGGATCEAEGEGTLDVEIVSPNDTGNVTVAPDGLTEDPVVSSASLEGPAGEYTLTAGVVTEYPTDERVGYVYRADDPERSVCVADGATSEVSFEYALVPGSHQLWFTSQNGDQLTGSLEGDLLLESGEVEPAVQFQGSAEIITQNAVAFDSLGNLWVSASDGQITVRLAENLGESSDEEPDRVLDVSDACGNVIPCVAGGLAFDDEGNLWVGIRDHLLRIDAADLEGSGVVEPGVTITGDEIEDVEALAFDDAGNLWVASAAQDSILMYESSRLDADDEEPADVVLTGLTPEPVVGDLRGPRGLAFDEDGALWAVFWTSNIIVKFEPEELEESAELTPEVQLDVSVLALPENIAFDQQGNLWFPAATGEIAAIAKAELVADGDISSGVTLLTSDAFGSVIDLAFNPPPDWSPIRGPE